MLIKLVVFAGIGLLLLGANVWYVRAVWQSYARSSPSVIAGLSLIGKDDADGKLGRALAHMLAARLGKIDRDARNALRILGSADRRGPAGTLRAQDTSMDELLIPSAVFEPLDINVTVGGVEVGGMFAWIQRLLADRSIIQLTVEYGTDKALVAGVIDASTGQTLYLPIEAVENDKIVAAAAFAIAQHEMSKKVPEVGALSGKDFQTVFNVLTDAADLNRRVSLGLDPGTGYVDLVNTLDPVAQQMDEWRPLLRFGADLANAAKDYKKALGYLETAQKSALARGEEDGDLAALLDEARKRVAAIAEDGSTGAPPAMDEDTVAIKKLLAVPAASEILRLLGVTSRNMTRAPVVGLVGAQKPADMPGERWRVVGAAPASADDAAMADYVASVVQAVQLVAPDVRFVSSGSLSAGLGTSEMVAAIEALVGADPRPEVILITFGPLKGEAIARALKLVDKAGIAIVAAAGNDPKTEIPLASDPELANVIFASAVTPSGEPTFFTQSAPTSIWAPGATVPVVMPNKDQVELRDGTTYSAAFAAAVVARLLDAHPNLKPSELLAAIRSTSRPVRDGQPKVMNLDAALAALADPSGG